MKRQLSSIAFEYAFEMASSSIRMGRGVTKEIGHDLSSLGISKNVCVFTDKNLVHMAPVKLTLDSLRQCQIQYEVFDDVEVEPTDASLQKAINYSKIKQFDAFVAVGGGSVIDTAKAANAYMCNPSNDFLDFVNAPIGKGMPIPNKLKPLIAVPTTAGTGSETTGVSILDHLPTGAKTGIRDRAIRPTLGIIDPDHTKYCGPELTAFTGLDVLCHALESFTAVPYHQRGPAPSSPAYRPAYQGSVIHLPTCLNLTFGWSWPAGCNPISDIWSGFALQQCSQYIRRAVEDNDPIAREKMCLAATAAGVGFGNAGVHLCHAMSYPISSCVKSYRPISGYEMASKSKIIPHGLSVILTAPAVFKWTVQADPDRHLKAAELLGANVANVSAKDAGLLLADTIVKLLDNWSKFVPNGLDGVGYTSSDIDQLVKGTLPQQKVIDISPRKPNLDDFHLLLENSMKLF